MGRDGGLPQEEKTAIADRTRCEAGILRKSAFYVEKCSLLIG